MSAEFDPTASQENPRTRVPLRLEEMAIAAAMAAIALITAANVVVRYLTDVSFAFTEEFSVLLMVLVTLLGTSLAVAGGRHIRIGYFVDLLPARGRRRAEILAMTLTVAMFGLLVWYGARLAWDEYRFEQMTSGLGHPQWLYTMWLPLLALAVIGRAIGRAWRERK